MKRKTTIICLLLALLMILSACGGTDDRQEVGAVETPQLTAEPTQAPAGPGVTATGAPAKTSGKLVFTMDYDLGILDGDGDSGWFVCSWLAKGYGTRYYAVNAATGQVIEGEEGAEVVLCANGLVRFVWKDAAGNEVSADTVYSMDIEAQTYDLFAQIYGLDGTLREERKILSWTQTDEDPYFGTVLPAMNAIVSELGGGNVSGHEMVLSVTADGADAVINGFDGEELIRLSNVDASEVFAYASSDGSFVSVYRPDSDQTEFYRF